MEGQAFEGAEFLVVPNWVLEEFSDSLLVRRPEVKFVRKAINFGSKKSLGKERPT